MVLYYPFEEVDSLQVIDASGNRNHGKIHGAGYAEGRAGKRAMAFDGRDDYISIPGIHLQRFTFSAVVRPHEAGDSADNQRLFLLDGDKGYYALQASSSAALAFRASIHGRRAGIDQNIRQSQIGDWTIIAVTCDGFTVKLYRNGELTGQGRIFGDDVAGTAYIGGTDAYGGRFWHGMIDEVALFNEALTSEEIKELCGITADGALPQYLSAPEQKEFSDELMAIEVPEMSKDVVLCYSFDKNYSDEALDNSGRGHHAHVHGASYVRDGYSGGALSFDGQDDYLTAGQIHLDNFTFSAFVKTFLPGNKPNTNNRRLFLLYDGPRYYALQGNSRGSIGLDVTGAKGVNEYHWGFEPHTWTHITVTYERPTVKIYKDGKLTQVGQVDVPGVTGTLYIGGTEKHWGRFWHGLMDDVFVFDRALTQDEVNQLLDPSGSRALVERPGTISPTVGLDNLIESIEAEVIQDAAERGELEELRRAAKQRWENRYMTRGKPDWLEDPEYYRSLSTLELADECFSKYTEPVTIFHVESMANPGPIRAFTVATTRLPQFDELFRREDVWKGMLFANEALISKFEPGGDKGSNSSCVLALTYLSKLYAISPVKEQTRGREKLFLVSYLRLLKKFKGFIETGDAEDVFYGEPVQLSHMALAFAKKVDPQRYSQIEPGLKSIRHPAEQKIEYVQDFISLVIEKLEGFVSEQDYIELDNILGKETSRPEPARNVSPTSGIAALIRKFENGIGPEKQSLYASVRQDCLEKKKRGDTLRHSAQWMKDPDHYASLETRELAVECLTIPNMSKFVSECQIRVDMMYGLIMYEVFHNGFAEWFKREDMWKGMLAVNEHLSSQIEWTQAEYNPRVAHASGVFDLISMFYVIPPLRKQIMGRERIFLVSCLRVLERYRKYMEDSIRAGDDSLDFFCEPCEFAQLTMLLAKQVDPQQYARIETAITSVRFSDDEQNDRDLLSFLTLLVDSLDGFVTEEGHKKLDEILGKEAPRPKLARNVSPTLGIAGLIKRFEDGIDPERQSVYARIRQSCLEDKKRGKTLRRSSEWMKDPEYYASLKTPELAIECLTMPGPTAFAIDCQIRVDPMYGMIRFEVLHNGWAEWFKREDMWKGMLHVNEFLSSRVDRIGHGAVFDTIDLFYVVQPLRNQIKSREGIFLASNLRVLGRYKSYLDAYFENPDGVERPSFFCEPCAVARLSLLLARQLDLRRYAEVETAIARVRWTQEQKMQGLLDFINLVITGLEGFVTEEDNKNLDEILAKEAPQPEPAKKDRVGTNKVYPQLRWSADHLR